MRARSHEELEVYQRAVRLQQEIFEESRGWPRDETYSLIDQIRRSSRSIGSNLAEGWAKRRYLAHFTSKLTDSDGEQMETRHWLLSAKLCGYLSEQRHEELLEDCKSVGRMLGKMLAEPKKWVIKDR